MTNEPEDQVWRIGEHYGIHIYAGEVPIATALDSVWAERIVTDHNGMLKVRRQTAEAKLLLEERTRSRGRGLADSKHGVVGDDPGAGGD